MYEYTYDYSTTTPAAEVSPIFWIVYFLFIIGLTIFYLIVTVKIYQKAGYPGWAAIVPIYNVVVLFQIAKMSGWMVLLLFVPIVNFVITIMLYLNLAKVFGKDAGFGLGLFFLNLIFMPILAFGSAEYDETLA